MTRALAVPLALVMLTQLDGNPVWVESTSIQAIRPADGQCHGAHGAALRLGSIGLCVKETPEEIRKKLNETKPTVR
jgi:hypothetical protein